MTIEHYKASDLTTTNWSGGTTTQLAIYPKDANYKNIDFLFRISTATVETEQSIFTKLPSVSRKLMILDGKIKIEHTNRHTKNLKKFEQDEFLGNWDTKSYGKAIDFNLMTTGNINGEIEAITLKDTKTIILNKEVKCFTFYFYYGTAKLSINNKSYKISTKDFFMIFPEKENFLLELSSSEECQIIITEIIVKKKP